MSVCEVGKISPYGAKVKNAGNCVSIAPWPHRYTMVPFKLFQVFLENIKTFIFSIPRLRRGALIFESSPNFDRLLSW